jgi:WD40 repeat protein
MGEGDRKGKTAVVFVHGQGEHVPLGSAPELARTVCATDPEVPVDAPGSAKVRLSTDASISDEETPRASVPCKGSVEFFEYYWSDLMTGNQIAHVWRWFRNLIRKSSEETPARILPARQLFIRIAEVGGVFVAAFTLFTVSVSILLADAAKVSAQDFFEGACWSTGGAGPAGWPAGVTALAADPLQDPRGYDDMLSRIRQDGGTLRTSLGMGPSGYQDQGLCLAPSVGGGLFDRTPAGALDLMPSEQRVLRAGCATLDRDARDNARRVVACLDWNARSPDVIESDVLTAAFDATGARLVTTGGDSVARVWDATTYDAPELDFDDPSPQLTLAHDQIFGAAFSPSPRAPRLITWGYDGALRLWDSETGEEIAVKQFTNSVYGAAFSPDGRRALAWDGAGSVWVIDAIGGADIARLPHEFGMWSAMFSPDGSRVLTWDDTTVRIWDASKGGQIAQQVHEGGVWGATFPAQDSSRVLSWDYSGARVWIAATGSEIARQTPPAGIASAAISPDGQLVVTASYEHAANVWEARRGAPPPRVLEHDEAVYWARFSRDGRWIVTAAEVDDEDFLTERSRLNVWDAASGERRATGPTHDSYLYDAAFSLDGAHALTWDNTTAIVWDLDTGVETGRRNHAEGLSAAAFSADGARIVSTSGVGTAQVWDEFGGLLFELGTGRATKVAREALASVRTSLRPTRAAADEVATPGQGFAQFSQAEFQSQRPAPTVAEQTTSTFRYLIAWVRASASESHDRGAFQAILLAPVAIGALILFVIFSDWLGLARRGAADAPSLVRERFMRCPKWLYFLVMFFAPWLLIAAYGYISSETGWRSDEELIAWFALATLVFGGAAVGALTMLARHLLDAHALRALGPLPPRRSGKPKLRAWTMLVWVPVWVMLGLLPLPSLLSGGETAWPLLVLVVPALLALAVFYWRRRRLKRQAELEAWSVPWHLVQLFLLPVGMSVSAAALSAGSGGFGPSGPALALAIAAMGAAVVFVLSFTGYLSDDRGGPIRHLAFAVIGGAFATAVVWWGAEVASALGGLGAIFHESGRQAALMSCAIVVLALFLHLVRVVLARLQRSGLIRRVVLPAAVVGGFLYFVYWTVTYLGGQFAEERTIQSANEEIETTLALQDVADDSRRASSVRLVDALRRSDELQYLAIRTFFDVRQAFPAVPLTPPTPPVSVTFGGAAFGGDGARLITWGGDSQVRVWDAYSGDEVSRLTHDYVAYGAQFSPNGARVLSWDDVAAHVWDAATGVEITRYDHGGGLYGSAFNAAGDRVLSWDYAGAWIWDPGTGAVLVRVTHEGPYGAQLNDAAERLLTWGGDGDVRVWDAATGDQIAARSHGFNLLGTTFSPDGSRVLSWDGEGAAIVWDAGSGAEIARQMHEFGVYGAAFAPDGARALSWGGDGLVRVWDAATGVEVARQVHDSGVYGATFSPDGSYVLSWAYADARVWNTTTGVELSRVAHAAGLYSATFDAYGAIVVTVGDGDEVRVWEASSGTEIAREAHGATVYGAVVNVFGDRVATWGEDGGARIWDPYATIFGTAPIRLVATQAGDASAALSFSIVCDDLIGEYAAYAACIDSVIFSEDSLVVSLEERLAASRAPDPAPIDAAFDPFGDSIVTTTAVSAPVAKASEAELLAREVERDFFNAFLFELNGALGEYANVDGLQVALIWAGFAVLLLIWARMLVASLVVAVAVAPMALLAALGNNVELRLLNVENRLAADSMLALGESPLRLVNGAYGFFLAFCLCWFIVQILRELFDLQRVRGLPHLALALSAAFGVAAYNAGGEGRGFGVDAAAQGFPLELAWAAVVVGVLAFATWIVVQILREMRARSWIARAIPFVLALLVVAAGWGSYLTVSPEAGVSLSTGGIASVQEVWTVAVVVVLMVVIGGVLYAAQLFLVPIMADSARYLSPKPTNIARRRDIVDRGVRLLRALTRSGRYDRIVIVAHSLGTLVAFDALNRWWSHFEENVRRDDLRGARAEVATAASELADGARRGLASIADGLSEVVNPPRKRGRGAKGGERLRAEDARTDEKRVARVCELLGELASAYEKAGETRSPRPARRGEPAKPTRALRGRAARARAGEALREAMRRLRAGPASFGRASHCLHEAAERIRAAFGLDPKSPGKFSLRKRILASAAATADGLDSASDLLSAIAKLHERHLAAQQRLAAGLASGSEDQQFLVTDLVTLGSPLTHGEYLLGADHRVRTVREDEAGPARPVDALEQRLSVETPVGAPGASAAGGMGDDGATFPGVRWTNLYFRGPNPNLLRGDIVGGPLWPVFGPAIVDEPLDEIPNNSAFGHNEYWKSVLDDATLVEKGPPEHIRFLRAALRLVPNAFAR